jgi:release factor glutamine methyltransferase
MGSHTDANVPEWTIGRLLNWTTEYLGKSGADEPRLSAEVLLAQAAGCRRIDLYARFDRGLTADRLDRFREWVRRAAAREPVAYIVEDKEFFSLGFRVSRAVLIPRPETETLVECALDHCASAELPSPQILDVGTGSGCIVVALLVHMKDARAVATDVSSGALKIAEFNARRHGVLDRLTLLKADRFALPLDVVPEGGFDVVVSNPPYVSADAMCRLDSNIRDYEPTEALTDGQDGLSFYRSISADAPAMLAPGGVLIVEVGDAQAAAAVNEVERSARLVHRRTRTDRTVGQERVLEFSLATGD